ncbi:exodeoxyribonuclease VII large subunit [Eubacteriales bacterium OttesenSCG-928-K08]|nr:exodeoxyribonuclease VII large subunit [Eubacteriales bacterium OttesenSCG-928-K08]
MQQRTLSVSQLNEYVGGLLGRDPLLRGLNVQGELSGFKRHTSGHMYFSLKDENALVRCVMFRQDAQDINFRPTDGMQVVVEGRAAMYAASGQFQLYVQQMRQQGEGELYRRFLLLKTKLEAQGYFSQERKRSLPLLPTCVGIVTSATGAALQDILNVIGRRFPKMNVLLCPALVQGVDAADEIAAAIRALNQNKRASVIIVARGGGSMEDLWAFNEMPVAQAIYDSEIPVITGVGHETDFTIADFVADYRAPTPSAAAEISVPEYDTLMQHVDELYSKRLPNALENCISQKRSKLDMLIKTREFLAVEHHINVLNERLLLANQKLNANIEKVLRERRSRLENRLTALAPLSVKNMLQRGFAVVSATDGRPIKTIEQMKTGETIKISMHDGAAQAKIEQIQKGKEHNRA